MYRGGLASKLYLGSSYNVISMVFMRLSLSKGINLNFEGLVIQAIQRNVIIIIIIIKWAEIP